jgi:hypothetical protein
MTTNGHGSDDLPEVEAIIPVHSNADTTPGTKGLFIQPFPGGQLSSPIDKFMSVPKQFEELAVMTNVSEDEIARDERIFYFQNIANYANGRMDTVVGLGYLLRRARGGQTQRDIVTMISGQRQTELQDWRERRNRVFNNARSSSGNPIHNASEMAGS